MLLVKQEYAILQKDFHEQKLNSVYDQVCKGVNFELAMERADCSWDLMSGTEGKQTMNKLLLHFGNRIIIEAMANSLKFIKEEGDSRKGTKINARITEVVLKTLVPVFLEKNLLQGGSPIHSVGGIDRVMKILDIPDKPVK